MAIVTFHSFADASRSAAARASSAAVVVRTTAGWNNLLASAELFDEDDMLPATTNALALRVWVEATGISFWVGVKLDESLI